MGIDAVDEIEDVFILLLLEFCNGLAKLVHKANIRQIIFALFVKIFIVR
jgi:hypothetical protein